MSRLPVRLQTITRRVLSRTDLAITRAVLVLCAVVVPVVLIVLPVLDWAAGRPLAWSGTVAASTHFDSGAPLAAGTRLHWDGHAGVTLADPSPGLWLATLVPAGLSTAAICFVLLMTWQLLGRLQAGTPFVAASVTALRSIAFVVLVASIVVPLASSAVNTAVMAQALEDATPGLTVEFNPILILTGVLVLALAEAFQVGVRLSADVEGLV